MCAGWIRVWLVKFFATAQLQELATDIAEDFNLGGRGHRASPEEAGGPSAAGKVKNRMS